jgi:3-oxoacyl-[acyl-carrier protein] reductase
MMEHKNRTALVTGAAGAIGLAATRDLIETGAHVVMVDLDADRLNRIASTLGDDVTPLCLDVGDVDATQSAMAKLLETRSIDILVNSAGVLSNNKLAATTLEEWHRLHRINLDSAFVLSQAVVPGMAEKGWGRIINIASWAAKCGGLTAGTSYTVSKSAMIGLTFSVAREMAAQGITANAIAPAYVMSPMVSEQLTQAERDTLLSAIPVRRFCNPDEVAHAVTFLASAKAGFITGEVLDMNGGLQFD